MSDAAGLSPGRAAPCGGARGAAKLEATRRPERIPGGGEGTLRCGCCPRRAPPRTGGSRRAPLHGRKCLAFSRAPATERAALGTAGQGWAGLDRCAPAPSRWEEWVPVAPAVRSVWRESWRPRCPDAARLDTGRIRTISDGSRRIPANAYNLHVSPWSSGARTRQARRDSRAASRSLHGPPARPSTCPHCTGRE